MKQTDRKKFKLEHWHMIAILMMAYDVIAVNVAYFLALWIRFDCVYSQIPANYFAAFLRYMPIHTAVSVITLAALRMYNSI